MFTGIVEDMGVVVRWELLKPGDTAENEWTKGGWVLEVKPDHPALFFDETNNNAQMYIGASICVSGVCLTVTHFDKSVMQFGVAPETIRKTNFGQFKVGDSRVNLERASLASGRNSGHYVQGHVDGTGTLLTTWEDNESLFFKIQLPKPLMAGVVPKGFVAVEGTSLTVCEVNYQENWFTLMLIDHTQKCIVLPLKKHGDPINIEVDVMAKYVSSSTENLRQSLERVEGRLLRAEYSLMALSGLVTILGFVFFQNKSSQQQ